MVKSWTPAYSLCALTALFSETAMVNEREQLR
jgi:hypothetical protein